MFSCSNLMFPFFSENLLAPINFQKFSCEVCYKSYKNKGHLIRHVKFECLKPRQFQCPNCLKRFTQKDTLKIHIRNVKCLKK